MAGARVGVEFAVVLRRELAALVAPADVVPGDGIRPARLAAGRPRGCHGLHGQAAPFDLQVARPHLAPAGPGAGYEFVDKIVGGTIPREYRRAVDQGIRESLDTGIYAGYPMVDVKATVFDGSYHEVDSSEMAFKIAASMAIKDAVEKADPVILEPMMRVEVTLPEPFMGDVIGDLNSRRGLVEATEIRGTTVVVRAAVPLAEMFGYATDLRSMTQGRASYSMELSHYAEVPGNLAQELVAKSRGS